jgi:ATP-binding cassette subfamily C (CFTR/MRP) protein 1
MARGCLVSRVFSKTLAISATVAAGKGSSTLTLMSTDVERISRGLESLHELWASPIEVGIAIWLLGRQLGVACIVPGVIALGRYSSIGYFMSLTHLALMRCTQRAPLQLSD